jgi:hypothetical protein
MQIPVLLQLAVDSSRKSFPVKGVHVFTGLRVNALTRKRRNGSFHKGLPATISSMQNLKEETD